MYKVIEKFIDRDGKIYEVGEIYKSDDKERIKLLSSTDNAYNRPFIKKEIKRRKKKEDELNNE